MKNRLIILAVVGVLVAALFAAWPVAAQTETPPPGDRNGNNSAWRNGWGMMHGHGARRGGNGGAGVARGVLHDAMISVYAQELGISVDDLNDRLASGETMAQIAASQGLTPEQFAAMMADARDQAIEQAVADGTITQEQADWMRQRGDRATPGAGRGQGRGPGMRGGCCFPDCPYNTQPAP